MIKITGKGLRILKSFHLLAVISWMGASVCAFGVLVYSHQIILTKESLLYLFSLMEFLDYFIIGGALITIILGVVYAVFTHWGFIKTRWVALKWPLSLFIIFTGSLFYLPWLEQMRQIVDDQGLAAMESAAYQDLYQSIFFLLSATLLLFVLMVFLSTWRPKFGAKSKPKKQKKENAVG
jgi:uncharacterized membrane protein